MSDLKQALYEACLKTISEMGMDEVKQMSWFGKNHK